MYTSEVIFWEYRIADTVRFRASSCLCEIKFAAQLYVVEFQNKLVAELDTTVAECFGGFLTPPTSCMCEEAVSARLMHGVLMSGENRREGTSL